LNIEAEIERITNYYMNKQTTLKDFKLLEKVGEG